MHRPRRAVVMWCVSIWLEIREAESGACLGKARFSGRVAAPEFGEGATSVVGQRCDQVGRGRFPCGWERVDEVVAKELLVWILGIGSAGGVSGVSAQIGGDS